MDEQTPNLLDPRIGRAGHRASGSVIQLLGVIGELGGVDHSIEWLAPLAASGDVAAQAFAPLVVSSLRLSPRHDGLAEETTSAPALLLSETVETSIDRCAHTRDRSSRSAAGRRNPPSRTVSGHR
ncbi:hypothetical protein [Nocardia violaceofusca]|uniref:hypothetical protein n=1 Tax=Nocardia violaceofusca TaxID=941182 RepID=UPI0012F51D15|nr:hypothetical protein [Nocardia violaceofusca]